MRSRVFAGRCGKEMIRDPLTLAFGLGFPVVLLLLLSAIQANIPVELFVIDRLSPGIAVFGLSFIALFSALLIARDRSTSLMLRLFATPLRPREFILGYTLPLLPLSLAQGAVCFLVAFCLGLKLNLNVLLSWLCLIPAALLYIGIGLLAGSVLNDKQVGGICGAVLTNVTAWLSGIWFDLKLVGGAFEKVAYALPFAHSVDACRAAMAGNYAQILPHLAWVLAYAVVILAVAILLFGRKMHSGNF